MSENLILLVSPKIAVVGLYVDGVDVQYWKRLDASTIKDSDISNNDDLKDSISAKFYGFKKNVGDLQSFVFSTPEVIETSDKIRSATKESVGSIYAVIYEAKVEEGTFSNQVMVKDVKNHTKVVVPEASKFFDHASLTTTAGDVVEKGKDPFNPLQRWSNQSQYPIATLTLKYHSSSTLDILKRAKDSHQKSIPSDQSRKRPHEVIDMTGEDDDIEDVKHPKKNGHEEDDIVVLPLPPKILPLIDITDDVPNVSFVPHVTEVQSTDIRHT